MTIDEKNISEKIGAEQLAELKHMCYMHCLNGLQAHVNSKDIQPTYTLENINQLVATYRLVLSLTECRKNFSFQT